MTTELCDRTGSELAGMIGAGEVSAVEVVESSLRRLDAVEDSVRAFLTRTVTRAEHERKGRPIARRN